jgi:PKD repeat protein
MRTGNARFWLKLSAVLWLLFCLAPLFGETKSATRQKRAFPSIQLRHQVRSEEAVEALGARLPDVASWYGKTAEEMTRLLRHDRSLWVSQTGHLVYACDMELPAAAEAEAAGEVVRDHTAGLPLDQTFKLHSLPGSSRVVYLDFNGQTVSGTAWNASNNGGADIIAAPFDLDGTPGTFSTTELQRIQNIWKRVAEDYSPFDVDITTEEPSADALARSSGSDVQFGNRVIITPTNFYPNAGGVSYVGTFDSVGEYYKTSWVFSNMLANGEKYIAEACSHENGHSVGLHHEGIEGGAAYYQGQGDWAPIMGNSYYKSVSQWAKGEYTGANNLEDQLQVMQENGLAYFADDHGNTIATAEMLAGATSISGSGFIEQNTDVDYFRFRTGSGDISISVAPSPLGPNLKILAELLSADGNQISSSSLVDMRASISQAVPAGTYYLKVSGAGSGDPASTGYSNYASLGQYAVLGTIVDSGSTVPPNALISAAPTSGEAPLAVSFSGSSSTDDGTITSYSWSFGDGSATSNSPTPSHTYTSSGTFTATLTVTDNDGLTDSESVSIRVTKDIYISALTLTSSSSTTAVSARAAVTVKGRNGNTISGATVTGSWTGKVQGTVSGGTNASGVVSLSSPQSSSSGTFTFTVTGVSASGYTYNSGLNAKTSASISASLVQPPTDSTPPTINITSPVSGSSVLGNVSVLVNASDNVAVKKVELYVDGVLKATSTLAPFTTKWSTQKVSVGPHTLQTKAYDAAGNKAVSASVTITRAETASRSLPIKPLRGR